MLTASRAVLLLALSALAPARASAQSTEAPMPASVLKYVPANPNPAGFIRDVPGALSGADRRALNERITTIRGRIHGDIGVAILADIGDIAPYELGTAIYRSWKIGTVAPIGNARRDVGALVLLVPKELAPNHQGQCWITTGRGSEGAVIDAAAGAVCRERVIPAMKARDYAAAVDSAISGIEHLYLVGLDSLTAAQARELARVTETRALSQRGRSGAQGTSWRERLGPVAILAVFLGLAGVIIGIVWGIGRYLRFRARPCPRGHGRMQLLSESEDDLELEEGARFEERIGSVNYDVWRCPAPGCTERRHPAEQLEVRLCRLRPLPPARADLVHGDPGFGDAAQHGARGVHDDLRVLQDDAHDAARHAGPATPAAAVVVLELRLVLGELRLFLRRVGLHVRRRGRRELLTVPAGRGSAGGSGDSHGLGVTPPRSRPSRRAARHRSRNSARTRSSRGPRA